jgi:hypothetical protein
MTVSVVGAGRLELRGSCPVEDADVLLQHLLSTPGTAISWEACEWAHTAVIQVLLVAKALPTGTPANPFLQDHVLPLLQRAAS